jgi:magnesium chelatase subunit I
MTGKFELEYEGELKGAEAIAKDLVRAAIGAVYGGQRNSRDSKAVVEWFESGGTLPLGDLEPSAAVIERAARVPGLRDLAERVGLPPGAPAPLVASAIDFVLEGLCAERKIGREDERGYVASAEPTRRQTPRREERLSEDDDVQMPGGKKKYYN